MTQLLTPATFEFFARYLLAGYVLIIVRSYFVIGSRPRLTDIFVEAVVLSLINQLVFLGLAAAATWSGASSALPPQFRLLLEVLLLPAILGVVSGWLTARNWNSLLLRVIAVPTSHPIQRAYDYAFGQKRPEGFVIITYEDGTVVRGYFGVDSLAASDNDRSDLFLERLYSESEDGQWEEASPGRSGYLTLKGVRSIEFLDN